MRYDVVTQPTTQPLTLEEVKQHLRVETYGDHDQLIDSYIDSTTKAFEQKANVAIMEQTIRVYYDYEELADELYFYRYPVQSISSIQYYDDDNALQTLNTADYISVISRPTQIIIDDMPSIYDRKDALFVEFVAGFTSVPHDILLALKQRIYKIYNNPDDFVEVKLTHFEKVIREYRSYEK
jgi:uncharacterized phiE125 gp8 family phage protein